MTTFFAHGLRSSVPTVRANGHGYRSGCSRPSWAGSVPSVRANWRGYSLRVFLAACATLSFLSLTPCSRGEGVRAGDRFPDLAEFSLEGDLPVRAGKVVLVDFWASWCGPCKQSFPELDELSRVYGPRGLVVLGVSVDEVESAMAGFLDRHPVDFATVRDVKQELVAACAVEAMPTSFLIDCAGVVRFVHRGFHGDESAAELREHIEKLLPCSKGGRS